jgi:hypothetical protein
LETQRRAAKKDSTETARGTKATDAGTTTRKAREAPPKKAPSKKSPAEPELAERSSPLTAAGGGGRAVRDLGRVFVALEDMLRIKLRVSFARPDDLLVCDFVFENLKLDGERLVRVRPAQAATIIVELPPQSFAEQAFLEATGQELPPGEKFQEVGADVGAKPKNVPVSGADAEVIGALPSAKVRMAGRSRLAFAMPAGVTGLPFTAEAILDACRRWKMRLNVNASPEPAFRLNELLEDDLRLGSVWLASVVSSDDWARAKQLLVNALDDEGDLGRSLADAAARIAGRAPASPGTQERGRLSASLTRAMDAELDALARKFPLLSEGREREIGLAALSLMATERVAAANSGSFTRGRVSDFEFGRVVAELPFMRFLFAPHRPAANVTALEVPYRLIVSPIPESNWWHRTTPVVHNGRTELWHTRLTKTDDGVGVDPPTKIRALWSPDYDIPLPGAGVPPPTIVDLANADPPVPFRTSLDPLDRQMLVKLMSGFTEEVEGRGYTPRAARAQRLSLSALGALFDVEGQWDTTPDRVGLEQWRHIATLGRDHYVRVVYKGFLCPSGHAASLIKVTERKFEYLDKAGQKNRVAALRQKFFIVVREPVRHYDGTGHDLNGRNFPFTSVEILTRVTPTLAPPGAGKFSSPNGAIYNFVPDRACFWPMLAPGRDFFFQVAATDLAGDRTTFPMALLFVGVEANEIVNPGKPGEIDIIPEIIARYNSEQQHPRQAPLGNSSVCFAPLKAGAEGDPRLPTDFIRFGCEPVSYKTRTKARFYPVMQRSRVGIAAVQRLLRQPNSTVEVEYPNAYKDTPGGFGGGNPGEVFLKLVTPFALTFGGQVRSESLGGLATPSMAIQGLSRIMGPVAAKPQANVEAALADVIGNKFNPVDFFQGAKILGGVDVASLLQVAHSLAGSEVPKLLSRQLPDRIEARFEWATDIKKSDPLGLFVPVTNRTRLTMKGVVSSPIAQPSATTFEAAASLVHFRVNLFGFIIIWFDKLNFTSRSGSKPDVAVELHGGSEAVSFGGPLEFVNTLKDIIPLDGFSDPPNLSVTPSGISASYSLNIPSLAVGIFALEHVSLGAGFCLPFDAKPVEVRFNFSERQRPFSLTVSLLGGGGFFAIGIGTEGVREIEAALEFGAALAINLGVASGSVEIKAGIYFHWVQPSDAGDGSVELAGYVRLHGELSVLGLISASLNFNLQLGYLKEGGRSLVYGEASIEVEIEVLFLSFSVSVKCRREFSGADGDPKFVALIPDQSTWTEYCEAFAAEAA